MKKYGGKEGVGGGFQSSDQFVDARYETHHSLYGRINWLYLLDLNLDRTGIVQLFGPPV